MSVIVVERHLVVGRSRQDCYRYLSDFATCEQWDPGVARAEKTTPGAPSVGSVFDLQLRVLGRRVPMRYRLDQMIDAERLVLSGTGDGFAVSDDIGFSDTADGGTDIHYRAEMDLRAVPAAARRIAQVWCDRIGAVAMQGLSAALEQDGPQAHGPGPSLAERLLLPAAAEFTTRGYRQMPSRGLTRFLDGRLIAITGATGGLGLAAAQLLARLGASLVLIGRGQPRLQAAVAAIEAFAGPTTIHCHEAELSLIAECRRVGAEIAAAHPRLDGLINNAGALPATRSETAEGHEAALAINLLAPYALTHALRGPLKSARGRVINVVSGGLYLQPLKLDDLQFRARRYDGSKAYAQAKRALLTVTQQWAEAPAFAGVTVQAMHPGWAATPGVASSLPGFNRALGPWLRDARMGADTMVWLAAHPELAAPLHNGQLWFDRRPRPDAVIPGTAVSGAAANRLMDWLAATCAR